LKRCEWIKYKIGALPSASSERSVRRSRPFICLSVIYIYNFMKSRVIVM